MRCKLHELLLVAIVSILGASCAGPATTVDAVWTSPAARAEPPLRTVVTLFVSDNITLRHAAEDELAREMRRRGVQATPGYAIFSDGASDVRDLDTMKTRLHQLGYDGVVTMRIIDREQQVESVPATFDGYWGSWGTGYWGPGYWDSGYVYTETIYRVESAAYSLRSNRLMWSAITKTTDPASATKLLDDTTEIIAGELTQRGLAG